MKKEYTALTILGLVIFGYVLDTVAGPVRIVIKSPLAFLEPTMLSRYPFTAVSIAIKTIAVITTILLASSFVEKKYFLKAGTIFFAAALFELYAIQQLVTGGVIIPVQWNLTLSATGVLLLFPTIGFIVLGSIDAIMGKIVKPKKTNLDTTSPVTDNGNT